MNLAQRITTPAEGDDLALEPQTRSEIEDLVSSRRLKPGFRALFHGPSGTGKTLAAALLGKAAGLLVFRVDLSKVLPEWTEGTERSLTSLFAQAELQGWILFFDEADLLFDKRTVDPLKQIGDLLVRRPVVGVPRRGPKQAGDGAPSTHIEPMRVDDGPPSTQVASARFPLPLLWRRQPVVDRSRLNVGRAGSSPSTAARRRLESTRRQETLPHLPRRRAAVNSRWPLSGKNASEALWTASLVN